MNTGGLIPVKMCDSLAVLPIFQLLAKCVFIEVDSNMFVGNFPNTLTHD